MVCPYHWLFIGLGVVVVAYARPTHTRSMSGPLSGEVTLVVNPPRLHEVYTPKRSLLDSPDIQNPNSPTLTSASDHQYQDPTFATIPHPPANARCSQAHPSHSLHTLLECGLIPFTASRVTAAANLLVHCFPTSSALASVAETRDTLTVARETTRKPNCIRQGQELAMKYPNEIRPTMPFNAVVGVVINNANIHGNYSTCTTPCLGMPSLLPSHLSLPSFASNPFVCEHAMVCAPLQPHMPFTIDRLGQMVCNYTRYRMSRINIRSRLAIFMDDEEATSEGYCGTVITNWNVGGQKGSYRIR
ncbi:hypothetical protein EDB92DRAFT_1633369 [Lactarius akahatsu]|uniref:Uncharacterized protein n=1 Tax=Lactarius akahatsu TaxID=416441 RepID=A0AAD4LAT5_9AGAM|nr:hypothetical protein EDB92DRAFT_1633369 [Lactarius akahatsu]